MENSQFMRTILFAIAVYFMFVATAVAKDDSTGLDIALVIDSSGSMKQTDPKKLRVPAAKLFVSLLGKDDSTGVISFHQDAIRLANLKRIDVHGTGIGRSLGKVSSDGLLTNIYKAVVDAGEMLKLNGRPGANKIIVLMSDGKIDLGDPTADDEFRSKLLNDVLIKLKEQGIKVYTIAFTEASDIGLLETLAKDTGGFFTLLKSAENFHKVFTKIFESLKTPQMLPIERNMFSIDVSVKDVTIVANKKAATDTVRLKDPDGEKFMGRNKPRNFKWFIAPTFEMITISNPKKGKWQILFSAEQGNKAYIVTNLQLLSNLSDNEFYPNWPVGDTMNISVWLNNKDSMILNMEQVLSGTKFYAEIEKVDYDEGGDEGSYVEFARKKPLKLPLKVSGKAIGNNSAKYTTSFTPKELGVYSIELTAEGKTFNRMKVYSINVITPTRDMLVKQLEKQKKLGRAPSTQQPVKNDVNSNVSKQKTADTDKDDTREMLLLYKTIINFIIVNIVMFLAIILYLKGSNMIKIIKMRKKSGRSKD